MNPCHYCGLVHSTICPRIKTIEYNDNGTTKKVEFWNNYYMPKPKPVINSPSDSSEKLDRE